MDCIFCKIVKGEIPSEKVYEDSDVLAFLDISPVHKGHTLVIPKMHYETLMDTPDELLCKVIAAVKIVSAAVKKAVKAEGVSIGQSNHKSAGQAIPHLHFHVMPRFENDGLRHWPQGKYAEGEMKLYGSKIRAQLSKV
ncbi:MAG: HIT family protein [Candidatus Woesearchaeota archaeon]